MRTANIHPFNNAYSFFLLILICGCSGFNEEPICAVPGSFAIEVTADDQPTGRPLNNFYAVAQEGSYKDSMWSTLFPAIGDSIAFVGLAPDRPGQYDVKIGSEGYLPMQKSSIDATGLTENGCSVITVELNAVLVPAQDS